MADRIYPRDTTSWDITLIESALRDGYGKAYETKDGTMYVIKLDGASFAVRPHQISGAFTHETDENTALRDEVAAANVATIKGDADRKRAEALVERLFTARHGIAEVRDGEFREDELRMVEEALESQENLLDLYDLVVDAETPKAKAPKAPAPISRPGEDELLAHFGL